MIVALLNTFCASLGHRPFYLGLEVREINNPGLDLMYHLLARLHFPWSMQNTDICVTNSRVLIQECPGGSFQGWRELINRSLWAQLREDGLAIPEISGTGRYIFKMSCEGYSREIHIGYAESNASIQVSCPSGMNLKQYLSQLLHCSFSFSLPCSKAWFT